MNAREGKGFRLLTESNILNEVHSFGLFYKGKGFRLLTESNILND